MKFSVVIPTRNRPETLKAAVESCVKIGRSDVEFLVCDNSDPSYLASVKNVVNRFADPRIRLVQNPRTPCSMSANWSYALGQARGEYVTLIGDDDGMLRYSCDVVEAVIDQSGAEIVHWLPSLYWWPCAADDRRKNVLKICFGSSRGTVFWKRIELRSLLSLALRDTREWYQLPMVYNCFVHRQILERFRGDWGEHFLFAPSPDIYSGVAIAATDAVAVELDCPLNIHGLSGRSNGEAHSVATGDPVVRTDFRTLLSAEGIGDLPEVAAVGLFALGVADSFYRFSTVSPNATAHFQLDRTVLARNQAIEVATSDECYDGRLESLNKLHKHFAAEPAPCHAVEEVRAQFIAAPVTFDYGRRDEITFGVGHGTAFLNGQQIGLSTISDAAEFVSNALAINKVTELPTVSSTKHRLKQFIPPVLLDVYRSFNHRAPAHFRSSLRH